MKKRFYFLIFGAILLTVILCVLLLFWLNLIFVIRNEKDISELCGASIPNQEINGVYSDKPAEYSLICVVLNRSADKQLATYKNSGFPICENEDTKEWDPTYEDRKQICFFYLKEAIQTFPELEGYSEDQVTHFHFEHSNLYHGYVYWFALEKDGVCQTIYLIPYSGWILNYY